MLLTRRHLMQLAAALPLAAQPARKRRAESFFGLHFDLHPNGNDKELGKDLTAAHAAFLLDEVKPDYIQYDCKGHAGWLGYPSQVSRSSPGIVNDSLAIWRKATVERGVALYIHFSGVWDTLAVTEHPEWARGRPDGKPEDRQTSTFGPYVDERMIPQLLEVSEKYDLDGVWVDGECWATNPDYSKWALDKWGGPAPKDPKEPRWLEWLEFNRAQFRRYLKHYVETVRAQRPKFQIASNWLYSTMVPERPELPVDFISGDYLGNAAISRARLEARYMSKTGKPWDLMAWGFQQANSNAIGHLHKPAAQLMQEASIVLAQGGGFQIYYQPSRAGRFDESHIGVMKRVGAFCRERQAWCWKSEPLPQIGVVYSRHSLYRTSNKLFGGWGRIDDGARGMVDALIDAGFSVDVIPDWKLAEEGASYPLLVVPDWPDLGAETRDALLAMKKPLLVAGAENMRLFAASLGASLAGEAAEVPAWIPGGEVFAQAKGVWQDLAPVSAQVLETRHPVYDHQRPGKPAALRHGALAAIPGPVGKLYAATHAPALRDFVARVVERLNVPLIRRAGPPTVEIAARRKNGKTVIHLLNNSNMQVAGDYAALDFVPEVGPVTIRGLRGATARIEPAGRSLAIRDGSVAVDRVAIHNMLVVS